MYTDGQAFGHREYTSAAWQAMVTVRLNVVRSALHAPSAPGVSPRFEMWLRSVMRRQGISLRLSLESARAKLIFVVFFLGACLLCSKGAGADEFSSALHAFRIADEGLTAP